MHTQPTLPLSELRSDWIAQAADKIAVAFRGREFSSDEVYAVTGYPVCTGWLGAAIARLRKSGAIEEVGRVTSRRKSANCRKVSVWRVV